MKTNHDASQLYLEARKAVRDKTTPQAFLRLGYLYARGIGTPPNPVLSNYFYEKAIALGSKDVGLFLEQEYETNLRHIAKDFESHIDLQGDVAPTVLKRFSIMVENERMKKNYGILARLRSHLHLFYPDYDPGKAIDDLLNDRDTTDADLYYALSTSNNVGEVSIGLQDSLLRQLFAPVTQDADLLRRIVESGETALLQQIEGELLQCIVNIEAAYNTVCEKYPVEKQTAPSLQSVCFFPYLKVSTLGPLRKQALKCLLSLRVVDPVVNDEFLENLGDDNNLLNISCDIADENLQAFLLSFIELNIDIDCLETNYLCLIKSYRQNRLDALADHLNDFIKRLNEVGIEHGLPIYTPGNLPPIELPFLSPA